MVKRFYQIVVSSGIEPGDALVDGSLGGDDQDRQSGIVMSKPTKQGQAVAVGQAEIEEHEIMLPPGNCRLSVRNG